jgi:threonylcarbamoyladenosine tRNA methylthiotransferase MtaB
VGKFYLQNFGCRATQADGAAIEQQLLSQGWQRAINAEDSKVLILNTCTVTAAADQEARATIRRVSRKNPNCRILVTGCYAQRAPQEVLNLPGVEWVVGNSHKHEIGEILDRDVTCGLDCAKTSAMQPRNFVPLSSIAGREPQLFMSDIFAHTQLLAAPVFDALSERTRPNLKVQDGCNNRCSFCVIPYVRGRSRSLALHEVINQVQQLVHVGYREVVISGINLGRWGRDLRPQLRFEQLLRAILEQTDLERLRISSVEPMDWTDSVIDLVAGSPRIAKHAHVPMQSGSDRILRCMRRKYRAWHYRQRIELIRNAMPTAAIGADVMVGFPGETDSDFECTRRLIEDLPFTYLHVFTYSSRPGTPSAATPGRVPATVAHSRNRILRDLSAGKKLEFQRCFIGATIEAITLSHFDGERTEALTDNYLKIRLAGHHLPNQWLRARVESIFGDALVANLV